MRFDSFDGHGIKVGKADAVGIVGEPVRKRAGGLCLRAAAQGRQQRTAGRETQEFAANEIYPGIVVSVDCEVGL